MNRERLVTWMFIGCFCQSALAAQTVSPAAAPYQTPLSASDCPLLFGDTRQHSANAARRKQLLRGIQQTDDGRVYISRTGDYKEPDVLDFTDLQLVRIMRDNDSSSAQFRLARLNQAHHPVFDQCRLGVYELRVDDNIGPSKILHIGPNYILLEHKERIRYIASSDSELKWVMVWVSSANLPSRIIGGVETIGSSTGIAGGGNRPASKPNTVGRPPHRLGR